MICISSENPLISVVVPVYKVEQYLAKCIDSIRNQTYQNLEIILVDDGSPDSCPKICDDYAKTDSRIKVIHKQNGGLSDARNKGIERATGDYIGFVDSDDYIDEGMYEYLYNLIKENDADISTCGHFIIENEKKTEFCSQETMILDNIGALKLLADEVIVKSHAWNKLYRIKLFVENEIRFPVGRTIEDVATIYKTFYYSKTIAVGNKSYYNYLVRDSSIMNQSNLKRDKFYIEHMTERFRFFENNSELRECYFNSLIHHIIILYSRKDKELLNYLSENDILDNAMKLGENDNLAASLPKNEALKYRVIKISPALFRLLLKMNSLLNVFTHKYEKKHNLK